MTLCPGLGSNALHLYRLMLGLQNAPSAIASALHVHLWHMPTWCWKGHMEGRGFRNVFDLFCRIFWTNPFNFFYYIFLIPDPSPTRTICLMMLVSVRGGTWVLEQPGSSVLEYYPAWLHFLHRYYQVYGMETVGTSAQIRFTRIDVTESKKLLHHFGCPKRFWYFNTSWHIGTVFFPSTVHPFPGSQSDMVDEPLWGQKSERAMGLGQ